MPVKIQTIKDIRLYLAEELKSLYPAHEINAMAGIIIMTILKVPGLHYLAIPETPVPKRNIAEVKRICRELKKGAPLQYILGETSFYNCRIRLNSETLIPRPETEELVDLIIKENKGFTGGILDVGTGSGCIAIALAINLPGSTVTGIDVQPRALAIAEENARENGASVRFLESDIFHADPSLFINTSIIVSNPPYVRESERRLMSRNVIDFEPNGALFVPDTDPLVYYRAIIGLSPKILVPGGKIYFEINEALGPQVAGLLGSNDYSGVEIIKDLNGRDRFAKALYHG